MDQLENIPPGFVDYSDSDSDSENINILRTRLINLQTNYYNEVHSNDIPLLIKFPKLYTMQAFYLLKQIAYQYLDKIRDLVTTLKAHDELSIEELEISNELIDIIKKDIVLLNSYDDIIRSYELLHNEN